MIKQNITEGSVPLRKYLVKRKQMREDPLPINSSIFVNSSNEREVISRGDDPFRKYRTLTTKVQNNSTIQSCAEGAADRRLNSCREDTLEALPSISIVANDRPQAATLPVDTEKSLSPLRLKRKELAHHVSDPIYMRLEKTICRRMAQKHEKYKHHWSRSSSHRQGKDLLSRSFEKAAKNVKHVTLDAQRRRNTIKLEQMLRDNIKQKTFVCPATFNPEISGLKGRGGKVVPLFQEVFTFQEVLKIDRSRK